uniref:translation initiation factor IF-2-like n=1 Tax=Euleptes europaea TaxID=460621 RepID=UPI0025421894|nr:translation initiation factor IF-2-like [Euleptes europaea]
MGREARTTPERRRGARGSPRHTPAPSLAGGDPPWTGPLCSPGDGSSSTLDVAKPRPEPNSPAPQPRRAARALAVGRRRKRPSPRSPCEEPDAPSWPPGARQQPCPLRSRRRPRAAAPLTPKSAAAAAAMTSARQRRRQRPVPLPPGALRASASPICRGGSPRGARVQVLPAASGGRAGHSCALAGRPLGLLRDAAAHEVRAAPPGPHAGRAQRAARSGPSKLFLASPSPPAPPEISAPPLASWRLCKPGLESGMGRAGESGAGRGRSAPPPQTSRTPARHGREGGGSRSAASQAGARVGERRGLPSGSVETRRRPRGGGGQTACRGGRSEADSSSARAASGTQGSRRAHLIPCPYKPCGQSANHTDPVVFLSKPPSGTTASDSVSWLPPNLRQSSKQQH